MARDNIPQGSGFPGKTAGAMEWPMIRADTGAKVWVKNRRHVASTLPTILVTDSDTGQVYRETGRQGYVEPYEG